MYKQSLIDDYESLTRAMDSSESDLKGKIPWREVRLQREK